MAEKDELLAEINEMKAQMVNLAILHSFNFQHPSVLKISQELDLKINQFMKMQ